MEQLVMRNTLWVLALCFAATAAYAQSDGAGEALDKNNPNRTQTQSVEETMRSLGLTGTWAIDCSRPAGNGNIRAEFRNRNGTITQVQDVGGRENNNYEIQEVTKVSADRVRVRARFHNSAVSEINIFEWLLQNKRIRTMSNMTPEGRSFVVDGVIVSAKRDTPWLTQCG
jgi:hypothetical protein